MYQKLPVNNFEWRRETCQFHEGFLKSYIEESDEGYFLELDVQYPEKLHEIHNYLTSLSERIELEKIKKFVANLCYKTE